MVLSASNSGSKSVDSETTPHKHSVASKWKSLYSRQRTRVRPKPSGSPRLAYDAKRKMKSKSALLRFDIHAPCVSSSDPLKNVEMSDLRSQSSARSEER